MESGEGNQGDEQQTMINLMRELKEQLGNTTKMQEAQGRQIQDILNKEREVGTMAPSSAASSIIDNMEQEKNTMADNDGEKIKMLERSVERLEKIIQKNDELIEKQRQKIIELESDARNNTAGGKWKKHNYYNQGNGQGYRGTNIYRGTNGQGGSGYKGRNNSNMNKRTHKQDNDYTIINTLTNYLRSNKDE